MRTAEMGSSATNWFSHGYLDEYNLLTYLGPSPRLWHQPPTTFRQISLALGRPLKLLPGVIHLSGISFEVSAPGDPRSASFPLALGDPGQSWSDGAGSRFTMGMSYPSPSSSPDFIFCWELMCWYKQNFIQSKEIYNAMYVSSSTSLKLI